MLAIVLAALAVDVFVDLMPGPVAQETARELAVGAKGADDAGADVLSWLLGEAGLAGDVPETVVTELSRELFTLEEKESLRVSPDGTVVGYVTDKDVEHAYEEAAAALKRNGWTRVQDAGIGAGSFAKAGGACSMCFVSCTEAAGKTAVVVQCVRLETAS